MKNPEIKIDKYVEPLKKHLRTFVAVAILLFAIIMGVASYNVLFIIKDKEAIQAGEKRLEELNIIFDNKTIENLENQQGSTIIQGAAGQNPFLPL